MFARFLLTILNKNVTNITNKNRANNVLPEWKKCRPFSTTLPYLNIDLSKNFLFGVMLNAIFNRLFRLIGLRKT